MEAAAGRKPQYEVDQAQQDVLRARDSFVRTHLDYQQALDEFKIILSLPTDVDITLDQNELKALESIGVSEPDYMVDAAVETALLRRLDLANSIDNIDDALRRVILASEGLGTQLNITGTADVSSAGKTGFQKLQFHDGSYSLGVFADLPFERTVQRNAYRKALVELEQFQRDYDNTMDTVKLEVRQTYRQLQETAERYRIQKNSVDLAQKRVESTTLLLQAGRVTTRDLLEAQNAFVEAQNNLTAALVAHAVAKLSFFRDTGLLQVKPDGMWKY
jgi:outer membrane protein TolC